MTETPSAPAPDGQLATRNMTMPADANSFGNVFGGWVMSQMDIAGSVAAVEHINNYVVTVAVDSMVFVAPIHIGDVVSCYTKIVKTGRTSITVHVETWALHRLKGGLREKVTEADFTYVSVDENGRPTPIQKGA
ncbi:MAG: acyl-CoA thioesterase [Pseudomonadota bacterium]